MHHPKLRALGRGLVVLPGQPAPIGWENVERVLVDSPSPATLQRLATAWLKRQPLVVELAIPIDSLRQPEICEEEPYTLSPGFEFARERLHFLVWANNYDATRGEPMWWHGRLAQRLGAPAHDAAEVDGGPRTDVPFPVIHRESVEVGCLTFTQPTAEISLELAPDQLQAVQHRGGAARILAPAGSGKTRVLTQRLDYLLKCGLEPQRVTALAYNRRAALEMRQRLPAAQGCISTLHALGYSWLRQHGQVRLAKESELRSLLGRLVKAPALLNQDPLQPYLEALQQIRLGLRSPHKVERERGDVPGLAEAFPGYREELARRGWVDHDEQIYAAIQLLLRRPEVRKQAQRSCTHLLVDEFQDLTPAFLLLVRLLAAPAYQVFGVGDDDQVIYGYAGASPDFLVNFSRFFPAAQAYALQVNYRCPSEVVEAAGHLLRRNKIRVAKNFQAAPSDSAGSIHLHLDSADTGCTPQAVTQIQAWLAQYRPEEIAVLCRVNALLMPVQLQLSHLGIACTRPVDESILQRTGIRSSLAYLRLALQPDNLGSADLSDALRRPSRMLKRELLERASRCRTTQELARWGYQQEPWPASQIDEFLHDLGHLRKRLQSGLPAFFRCLRQETHFLQALDQLDGAGLGAAGASHRDDLLALEQTVAGYQGDGHSLCQWLEQELSRPGADQGVRLSSVHRVKGQEWPCVIVYGVNQGLFPHRLSQDLEEERRILHVAITRARHHCVLLAEQENPSSMLAEMQPPQSAPASKKKKKKKKRKG